MYRVDNHQHCRLPEIFLQIQGRQIQTQSHRNHLRYIHPDLGRLKYSVKVTRFNLYLAHLSPVTVIYLLHGFVFHIYLVNLRYITNSLRLAFGHHSLNNKWYITLLLLHALCLRYALHRERASNCISIRIRKHQVCTIHFR
jgi:hypothetical protein